MFLLLSDKLDICHLQYKEGNEEVGLQELARRKNLTAVLKFIEYQVREITMIYTRISNHKVGITQSCL